MGTRIIQKTSPSHCCWKAEKEKGKLRQKKCENNSNTISGFNTFKLNLNGVISEHKESLDLFFLFPCYI